jgi:hypothetical protein
VLDVTSDRYYVDPARHFRRLYSRWLEQVSGLPERLPS